MKLIPGWGLGKDNYNWNGGTSPYPSGWNPLSKAIKERDNFQCQSTSCKGKSKILLTHHVDFNKKNNNPSNLMTVCKSCHAIIHKLGRHIGYKVKKQKTPGEG